MIVCQQIGYLDEMNKFLETQNLPRLNHEEIENLNTSVTNKKIKSVIKKVSQLMASMVDSTKHLKN